MAALYVKALTGLLMVFFLSGIHLISSEPASLFITTPKTMEALSGSCVQIPCNFSTRDEVLFSGTGDTFGVWLKDSSHFGGHPERVIFNSSKTVNPYQYQGEIPGDLRQRNCTTIFYNLTTDQAADYYFRVVNNAFKATAIDDPFKITVTDDAPSPNTTHNISSVQKEGDIATFTCSAIAPCPAYPPVLQWNPSRDADTQTQLEENTDRTITARSQMTLTLAEELDGVNVSCSVHYPVNGTESNFKTTNKTLLRLDVSYSPKRTSASISPAGAVSVGSWVNLTCTSTAKPRVHSFIWFKTSKDGPTTNVSVGYFYSFNVSSADDGGAYYCEATNNLGTQRSPEIHLPIDLPIEGSEDPSVSSLAIIGVIITVVILMIFLGVSIWWLHSRRSVAQTQRQLVGVPASQNVDEDIHYGEIDFSKMQSNNRGSRSQVTEPEPNTEYAEVKAGQRRAHTSSNVTETANEPNDDIYAQVKKH